MDWTAITEIDTTTPAAVLHAPNGLLIPLLTHIVVQNRLMTLCFDPPTCDTKNA